MTNPSPGPAERAGRVVHLALLAGMLTVVGVLVVLRTELGGPEPATAPPLMVMRVVVLALVVGATLGLRILRATLPPLGRRDDRDAWWGRHGGKVIALWALPEGVGIAGGVLHFVTGDGLLLVLAVGWGVAMLLWHAPGRVAAE
ncbi:MAG: hypothetical protein OER21_08375 [Gemmatimonadota bacterium]|nr:hypothetical protein [Gemmatimonadota bacterium]